MATLHGKALTAKQRTAIEKKWKSEDKKYWTKVYRKEVADAKAIVAKYKKKLAAERKKTKPVLVNFYTAAVRRHEAKLKDAQRRLKKEMSGL